MPNDEEQSFYFRNLLLVVFGILLILTASLLFFLYKNKNKSPEKSITISSELNNFNIEIANEKAVDSWIPEGAEYGFQIKLAGEQIEGNSLRFMEGETLLGSSTVAVDGEEMTISVYLAPEVLNDSQKADYILSYLVLKTLGSVRAKGKFQPPKDSDLTAYLNEIKESGGIFPFNVRKIQN